METLRSKHKLPPLRLASLDPPPPTQDFPHQIEPTPQNHYLEQQTQQQQRFLQNEPPSSPFVFFNNEVPPSPFHSNRSGFNQPTIQSNPYSQQLQQAYPSPQTPNFPQYQSTPYHHYDSFQQPPVIINSQINQSNIVYNHNHYPQIPNSNLNASTSSFQLPRAGTQSNQQFYQSEVTAPINSNVSREWEWQSNQNTSIPNHTSGDGNNRNFYWNQGQIESSNAQLNYNQNYESESTEMLQSQYESDVGPSPSASNSTSTSASTLANQARRPFIEKLSHILEAVSTTVDESGVETVFPNFYSDTISFDETGEYILVLSCKGGRLENEILPHWFSHKSTAAFSRQMNLYQFTHLTRAETSRLLSTSPAHQNRSINPKDWRAWKHPKFLKFHPLLRLGMKPTPSKARREAKAELDFASNSDKSSKFDRKLNWNGLENGTTSVEVTYAALEPVGIVGEERGEDNIQDDVPPSAGVI